MKKVIISILFGTCSIFAESKQINSAGTLKRVGQYIKFIPDGNTKEECKPIGVIAKYKDQAEPFLGQKVQIKGKFKILFKITELAEL